MVWSWYYLIPLAFMLIIAVIWLIVFFMSYKNGKNVKSAVGGSGGGTQLYRQTIRYTSGSDLGYFSIITTTATAYTNGADINNDWNNVVSAKYGANAAGHDTCLFVDDDSAVYVGFDGIHTTNFPPMKVWTTASVTPL